MTSTALAFAVVVVQFLPGAIWWALLRRSPRVSAFELLGMGLALGTFAAMATAMLLHGTAIEDWAWAVPALLTLPLVLVPAVRRLLRASRPFVSGRESVAAAVGVGVGLLGIAVNWARIPLDAPATSSFTDLYFFEALSRGLAEFGPTQSILMSGGSLRYHWFTYAWAGELAQAAGSAPFVAITRLLPVVTLVGVVLLVVSWSASMSRVRWVPSLAALLVVVGGYAGALYGSILNFDSPSQAMTTMWLIAFAVAFLALTGGLARWPAMAVIAALATACTGGKVSHAIVAAGGAGLATVVGAALRTPWWRRAAAATLASGAAMAATYLAVLAGVAVNRNLTEDLAVKASTWQGLDPLVGRGGVALGTMALVLAVLPRVAGLGWLLGGREGRRNPAVLFSVGGLLVGLAAMLALSEGVNELWFVLAASAPAAVVSASGVGQALGRLRRTPPPTAFRRPLAWAVAVSVPATLACLALTANWTEHRALLNWLAPISVWVLVPLAAALAALRARGTRARLVAAAALTVAGLAIVSIGTRPSTLWTGSRPVTTEAGVVLPSQGLTLNPAASPAVPPAATAEWAQVYAWAAEAATWIDANVPDDAVLATGEPVSALVPALTGRRMYIAGSIYQVGLGSADEIDDVIARSEASRRFAAVTDEAAARPLCEAGVRWAWLDGGSFEVDPAVAEVVHRNGGVTIVRLTSPACS